MAQTPEAMPSQVKLDATVGVAPWAESYDRAALSPTMLGEIGATMAQTASNALAQKWGYEAGLNPHGDMVIPPLTKADQAYANAYISQSQTVLGLQAQQMMSDAQNELANAWTLTPDMISEYQKNMSEGLNAIIAQAPTAAKPGLTEQYGSALIRSSSALSNRMISQQKEQSRQQAALDNANRMTGLYDAGRMGQVQAAEKIYNESLSNTERQLSSGMITPLQAEANRKSARITYYSGLYSGQAMEAWRNKKADEFLAGLLDKRPEGIGIQEWEGIATNVMKEVSLAESFQQRNEQSLYSEAHRMLAEGGVTQDFLATLESQSTSKSRFNEFMAQYYSVQQKQSKAFAQTQAAVTGWTNSDLLSQSSETNKTAALNAISRANEERAANMGQPIDPFTAQVEAMRTASVPVKSFTDTINTGILSTNPGMISSHAGAYRRLLNANPVAVQNVSPEALAKLKVYDRQLMQGMPEDVAALNATKVVQQKDPTQVELNNQMFADWQRKKINTTQRMTSWAASLAKEFSSATLQNNSGFAEQARLMMKDNMMLVNGDVQAAEELVSEGLQKVWGDSSVNGKNQFVYMPVEKVLNLSPQAAPIIREDIYTQLQKQVGQQKDLFDQGNMDFYWRLPERPNLQQYLKAKSYLDTTPYIEAQKSPEKYQAAKDLVKRYDNELVEIEMVTRQETKKYTIEVNADPGLAVGADGTVSSYATMIRGEDGALRALTGYFGGPISSPYYNPNKQSIANAYAHYAPKESPAALLAAIQARKESGVKTGWNAVLEKLARAR